MEFFDFEQADPQFQSPNTEQNSELANLLASISPSIQEIDFFDGEVRAMHSLGHPTSIAPSSSAAGDAALGT